MSRSIPQKTSHDHRAEVRRKKRQRLPLHVFEVNKKWHVFDPESGKFFRVDKVAKEIILLLPWYSMEEMSNVLRAKYSPEVIARAQDEISQLKNAGLVLPDDLRDDEKPKPQPVKPRLVSLTLNVAAACNLNCIYCWNKGGSYGRTWTEKRMDVETARRAVDLMVENSLDDEELLVDFYGGEPLLNFEVLRDTMEYCKEIESRTKKRFAFKVTTNGTLLTEEMIAFFNKMGVSLGISIDGTKEVHDRNRPFPDGSGSWNTILRNIKPALKANNIHVSSRATLAPPDLDMVKATKALFKLGFYDTEVEYATESCEAFNPQGILRYSESDIDRMKKEYFRFAKFYLSYTLYRDEAIDVGISNNITRVLHESHRFSPCGAGSNFICVTEEGDMYPCMGFIGMPEYFLGNVKTGMDLERLKSFRHEMRSVIHEAEECGDCWARFVCAGNCPANNEQHNKELFKPYKRGCDWLKFQLEVAMWAASEISLKKPSRLEGYEPA